MTLFNVLIWFGVSGGGCVELYTDFHVSEFEPRDEGNVTGEALYLTPRSIEEAKASYKVTSLPTKLISHSSGYFTVNEPEGGQMFFSYFPSQVNYDMYKNHKSSF